MSTNLIAPQTDGVWPLTIKDPNGNIVIDATVTATVYGPNGVVATNVSMPYSGAAGIYNLAIAAAWSDNSGVAVVGTYKVVYTATRSGTKLTDHFTYIVQFGDEP